MLPDKYKTWLQTNLQNKENLRDAWKNVRILTKEDGSYYKAYKDSFENLKCYPAQNGRKRFSVKYEEKPYDFCYEITSEDRIVCPASATIEEIADRIRERVAQADRDVEDARRMIVIADAAFDTYKAKVAEAQAKIAEAEAELFATCNHSVGNELYRSVKTAMDDRD